MKKEEFNYVMGYVDGRNGYSVMSPDKKIRLSVDFSQPITLARCKEILQKARELSERPLTSIKICHSIYSKTEGNECGDFPETCFLDKKYHYTERTNSLVIYKDGEPIYANDNGVICDDPVALQDSIGDIL